MNQSLGQEVDELPNHKVDLHQMGYVSNGQAVLY